jgi:hypothetical protein
VSLVKKIFESGEFSQRQAQQEKKKTPDPPLMKRQGQMNP